MSRLEFAPPSEEIRVDIETGTMEFTTQPGRELDREKLRRAIEEAGYSVHSVSVGDESTSDPAGDGDDEAAPSAWWWPF